MTYTAVLCLSKSLDNRSIIEIKYLSAHLIWHPCSCTKWQICLHLFCSAKNIVELHSKQLQIIIKTCDVITHWVLPRTILHVRYQIICWMSVDKQITGALFEKISSDFRKPSVTVTFIIIKPAKNPTLSVNPRRLKGPINYWNFYFTLVLIIRPIFAL